MLDNGNKNGPITLEFKDLLYSVPVHSIKSETKTVLDRLSGRFSGGQLTAIMGPSGAGKTSLLNILAGHTVMDVGGKILVNGVERNLRHFKKNSCYITQEFAFLQHLTVYETMKIAADLKLGNDENKPRKHRRICQILIVLGLEDSSKTMVKSLSGGEKKRLSIAVELLTNPRIMFFDEPTSGLDSSSSVQVMLHLKSLVQDGRAVICSIHQPSSKIFKLFDHLYILSEGHCLYRGRASDVLPFFSSVGHECPSYYNPADFVIEVASGDRGDVNDKLQTALEKSDVEDKIPEGEFAEETKEATETTKMLDLNTVISIDNHTQGIIPKADARYPSHQTSLWAQFWILYKRTTICTWRNMQVGWLRIFSHVIIGIFIGLMFMGIGNEASEVFSNVGCVSFVVMFLIYGNIMQTVITFPAEMDVFRREYMNNWYSLKAYYFAKSLVDLPFQILCPTLFIVAVYFLTDQPPETTRFFMVWALCTLQVEIGQNTGLLFGAAFGLSAGIFGVVVVSIPQVILSGCFLQLKAMPYCMQLLSYTSYVRYSYQGVLISLYGYGRGKMHCSTGYCHFKYPSKLLEEFGVEGTFLVNFVSLLVIDVILRVSIFIVLLWRTYRIRPAIRRSVLSRYICCESCGK